jgi:hypothetical protein
MAAVVSMAAPAAFGVVMAGIVLSTISFSMAFRAFIVGSFGFESSWGS